MLDLETLSTANNARIVAIGAVKFLASQGVYDKFYQAIATEPFDDIEPGTDYNGFDVSEDTLNWWRGQGEEARKVFTDHDAVTIWSAINKFKQWVLEDEELGNVRMWGNGSSFDNVILTSAYDLCGMEKPWRFYNDRCYRTIKNTTLSEAKLKRIGTHHNAVDDAESQALHLLDMGANLR